MHHKTGSNILKKHNALGLPFFLLEDVYPKKFKNVISVSKQTLKKFRVNGKVLSNGISNVLKKENLKIGNYILYVGRIDFFNKGLDLLINGKFDFPIVLAGKGKDEGRLKHLNPNYKYLGYIDGKTKVELIKNSKFLVMPSRYEGQGIVALESASMGKPLVVSDIPELKYVVDNGFGICFENGNLKDFKEKVSYLRYNENLILKMGKKGIDYAKNFTWDKIVEKYENYLLKVYRDFHKC